jgi:endonuclease YncB( thermonuclease family)
MTKLRHHVARACTAAALFFFASMIGTAGAAELSGRVVAVADGDTFTLLTGTNERIRVRLTEIDAPESAQPWGQQAKDALSALVFSQAVRVVSAGTDQYGRTLGRVYVAGKDVNAEMLRTGSAWAYRQYLTDASLIGVEGEARASKRGLWSLSVQDTEPPWEWRRDAGQAALVYTANPPPAVQPSRRNQTQSAPASTALDQQCGAKRVCRQMNSCAEAYFYFNVCHVRSMDGDHDGIPCEIICGH